MKHEDKLKHEDKPRRFEKLLVKEEIYKDLKSTRIFNQPDQRGLTAELGYSLSLRELEALTGRSYGPTLEEDLGKEGIIGMSYFDLSYGRPKSQELKFIRTPGGIYVVQGLIEVPQTQDGRSAFDLRVLYRHTDEPVQVPLEAHLEDRRVMERNYHYNTRHKCLPSIKT